MKEVKFGVILENACRLAGRDPTLVDIPSGWKVLAEMAIASGIRALAAEKFPMMQRIEIRRYRPHWSDAVTYRKGQEVWHNGEYWRMNDTTASGEPGIADGWVLLDMMDVSAFIAWEQPWENTVIDSGGVDTTRFAYDVDPKYHPDTVPLAVVRMNEMGILLAAPAPKEVYCRFVPEYPRISFTEYDAQATYSIGDVVYKSSTKDVYMLLDDEADEAPGEGEAWLTIRIRDEFAPYLTRLVAVDLLTEDQGKYQTRAAADAEFDALCTRFHEGNGETRIRRGRFI